LSRYHSYINSACQILGLYRGEEPFASFLKKYFSANKKFGSKDRKQVSNLCYCFFRLGKAVMNISLEEKILTALFLCTHQSNEILEALRPEWNDKVELSLERKCSMFNAQFSILNIFPWIDELSSGIDLEMFCKSFFIQPDLFLRLRPGKENVVKLKLKQAGILFDEISETCLSLFNSSKIDELIDLDREAVIQDYNSQQTGGIIKSCMQNMNMETSVWDCCAGSGGKSIMVYDLNARIKLTVSDVRESILANLEKRFKQAGIIKYNQLVTDLYLNKPEIKNFGSDIIIADVPCSGSGTWSRTPEQLIYFDEKKINEFSSLQKKIIKNVIPNLKAGGFLLYITCSVFKKENEEIAAFIQEELKQNLIAIKILEGFTKKADTMFVALLQKPLLSD